ncbi:glucose/arabinose dehydrogenase [Kibdelosporangium banguiense]|uniref:Glucose/arabinose dehydrogenase n=1 Tax=Kibdelosporangium banguiense TaxID=1365924 RepID=A0ABS4TZ57_9PSEU|nr:PQQ-dependent sugar dehydrogenase [Kibdelosporangium banguiense]MBP2329661.1 glucose/arabinose dehydrogenase [Kibdelosporangium banguiense]
MIRRISVAAVAACMLLTVVPGASASAPPSAPVNLRVVDVTQTSVTLAWDAATDDVGVFSYEINQRGSMSRIVGGRTTTKVVDNLQPNREYRWTVLARDTDRALSLPSNEVVMTTAVRAPDVTPPTVPANVRVVRAGANNIELAWDASADDVGVTGYEVRLGDKRVAMSTGTTGSVNGLPDRTSFDFTVVAKDVGGHFSAPAAISARTRPGADPVGRADRLAVSDDIPWGLTFLPDGSALFSERDAFKIYHLTPSGTKTLVAVVPDVAGTTGEGGLMGLAYRSGWLYVMHTTLTDNRVVRFKYANQTLDLESRQVLVSGIARSKFHNGGRLRFGPDGKLYASTGDAQNSANAQDLNSLNGKILRMNPDGTVPADNPFPGKYIWSYGHRNPQGLAFDSRGRLWQSEFGNSEQDELNLIRKGGNYGWPYCEGPCGAHDRNLIDPVQTWRTFNASPSGLTIVNDTIYLAGEAGQRLYRMHIVGDRTTAPQTYFFGAFGRLRTVEATRDGNLWLTATNGDKDNTPGNDANQVLHIALC